MGVRRVTESRFRMAVDAMAAVVIIILMFDWFVTFATAVGAGLVAHYLATSLGRSSGSRRVVVPSRFLESPRGHPGLGNIVAAWA